MQRLRDAAVYHVGNVRTEGFSYKLLDDRFYDPTYLLHVNCRDMTPREAARFVLRAALSFVSVPLPWRAASPPALMLLPQQVLWYVFGVLALVGAGAGWRREPLFTWILVGNIVLGAMAVALFNGNVGTLVRMRDSVVTMIVWLSALGGCALLEASMRGVHRGSDDGLA